VWCSARSCSLSVEQLVASYLSSVCQLSSLSSVSCSTHLPPICRHLCAGSESCPNPPPTPAARIMPESSPALWRRRASVAPAANLDAHLLTHPCASPVAAACSTRISVLFSCVRIVTRPLCRSLVLVRSLSTACDTRIWRGHPRAALYRESLFLARARALSLRAVLHAFQLCWDAIDLLELVSKGYTRGRKRCHPHFSCKHLL
jgi:hypothetical protein